VRVENEHLSSDRQAAEQGLAGRAAALESTRAARTALESELASARASQATLSAALRSREHDLAGLTARLTSLEELEAARADFSDAARVVLAEANGHVQQHGAVADWLEVDRRYERAVEALTGDLLQHVIVPTHAHAAAGLQLLREREAGRCGFLVVADGEPSHGPQTEVAGLQSLSSVVRASGPFASVVAAFCRAATSPSHSTRPSRCTCDRRASRHDRRRPGARRPPGRRRRAPGRARHSRDQGEIKELRARSSRA
jgi:chromosome segregation protein